MSAQAGPPPPAAWSFRDPDGCLERTGDGRILRHLTGAGAERVRQIQFLRTVRDLQASGHWTPAAEADGDPATLVHPRLLFPAYPAEWTPSMLHRAAGLTLRANLALLGEGWELKDASPSNVLFDGPRPVFVDHASPVRRAPGQRGWRAYGQFCRTFLTPLLLWRKRNLPLSWTFAARRDGVPPEEARPLLRGPAAFSPAALRLVTLPAWLGHRPAPPRRPAPPSDVDDRVTGSILKGLGRQLEALRPRPAAPTPWTTYQDQGISYTERALAARTDFLGRCLASCRPDTVLDLGCNAGRHALAAARAGAKVVALDRDAGCVDRLFLAAEAAGLDVLPAVADLAWPAPARGWNYQEEASLLARLRGRFDLTLALALVHHLLVRERTPLEEVVAFLAASTRRFLLLEWVPPADPQFRSLAGEDGEAWADLDWSTAAGVFNRRFRAREALALPDGVRSLHLLELREEVA